MQAFRWSAFGISFALFWTTQPAVAGLAARLVYLRSGVAEACPDQAALKRAVAKGLGYDPFLLSAPYTIVAEVTGDGSSLKARARLLDENGIVLGNRELTGRGTECAELMASLALAISLTLDPLVAAATPDPPSGSAPEPIEVVPALPAATTVPSTTVSLEQTSPMMLVSRRASTSVDVDAGLLGTVGWVPGASLGVRVGLSMRLDRISFGFGGVMLAPRTSTPVDGGSARVSLNYGSASICEWLTPVAVCALATLGRYSGEGQGVDAPLVGSHLHGAGGIGLLLPIRLSSRWALQAGIDGVRVLSRPEFFVSGQLAYQPSPWAGNLGISLSYRAFLLSE